MTKRIFTILGLGLMLAAARAQDKKPDNASPFKSDKEKLSYAWGLMNGLGMKKNNIDFDPDIVTKGLKDGLGSGAGQLTEAEAREVLSKWQQEMRAKQVEKQKLAMKEKAEQQKVIGEKNKREGDAFLLKNKNESGVITLPSGLQYKILTEGHGDSPKAEDTVTVNYKGTLIDGTEFDSSAKAGHPFVTTLQRVIPGWTEAVQLMKPGAKWKLFIPPALAYKDRGFPPNIGPEATLIFEIELISSSHTPPPAPATLQSQPLTSDIIKVPSADEMKKGAKIETIKPEDVEKEKAKEAQVQPKAN